MNFPQKVTQNKVQKTIRDSTDRKCKNLYKKKQKEEKQENIFNNCLCIFFPIRQKTIDANNIGWLSSNCQEGTRLYHSYPAG